MLCVIQSSVFHLLLAHTLKVITRLVIAFKQARWSALIKTSRVPWEERNWKWRGERLHHLSYQRAFPPVAKGKGAKHLLSGGIKGDHFKETGFLCTLWRQKWKPFDVRVLLQKHTIYFLFKTPKWLISRLKIAMQN